jgi:hypothetical protein
MPRLKILTILAALLVGGCAGCQPSPGPGPPARLRAAWAEQCPRSASTPSTNATAQAARWPS